MKRRRPVWQRLLRLTPLQWAGVLWLAWLVFAVAWWLAAPGAAAWRTPQRPAATKAVADGGDFTEVCTAQGIKRVPLQR